MVRNLRSLASGIENYLGRPGSIRDVVPISVGHSNQTYLLTGLDLVVRLPPEGFGLLPPYDMGRQHDIMAGVRAAAPQLPVPGVFGWSADESFVGAPFFLCERAAGEAFEYAAPAWLTDASPDFRRALCAQWVGAIAALHNAGPVPGAGPARTPEQVYGAWRDRTAADVALVGGPTAELGRTIIGLFDEAEARGLRRSGEPTTVHGDPKIGNTMWADGRLTALLDWEMTYHGEPLADLAYLLQWFPADPRLNELPLPSYDYFALPGMFGRSEVIATWERETGRSAAGVEAYELAEAAKICFIVYHGAAAYEAGVIDDERMAAWFQVAQILVDRTHKVLAASQAAHG